MNENRPAKPPPSTASTAQHSTVQRGTAARRLQRGFHRPTRVSSDGEAGKSCTWQLAFSLQYVFKYLFKGTHLTKAPSPPHPEFGLLIQAAAAAAG